MPVQGIKLVAANQNGVGAFILQCRRLDLHYCDHYASSHGLNTFLQSPQLRALTSRFPSTEFRVSPRPNKHPVLKAYYINGREKAVCVKNQHVEQVSKMAEYLLQNSGGKNRKIRGRSVVSANESVRGIWSPLHGGIKDV